MKNRKLKLQELNRLSINEFKDASKTPIVIVLDNIRSLNNIGSVFRTADSFRVEKIYLCGITATPPHRDIHKTAIGATETVEWEYCESVLELVNKLKEDNWPVFAVEQTEDSIMLNQFDHQGKIAVVMGNEVEGVQQDVVNACDGSLEIPQIGTKHSLNISVCAGIVVWDLFNKINS